MIAKDWRGAEMEVQASSVSETTKQDASVLGSCEQRKFAPAPIWTAAMLADLKKGVKGSKWSQTMAECVLRQPWALHDVRSLPLGAPIPMRKQLTGEPVAGKPHTGFGGRGRREPFPTPIQHLSRRRSDVFNPIDLTCLRAPAASAGRSPIWPSPE